MIDVFGDVFIWYLGIWYLVFVIYGCIKGGLGICEYIYTVRTVYNWVCLCCLAALVTWGWRPM